MIRLVPLGGTGDVYLVSALFAEFQRHHKQPATIVTRPKYAAIPAMFGIVPILDEDLVMLGQTNVAMQQTYDNVLLSHDRPFYAHPSFVLSRTRIDRLTAGSDVSQADMYRAILQLPLDAPLTLPRLPQVRTVPNTVLLMTHATSWPNNQPEFWVLLAETLRRAGWQMTENDERWPYDQLFARFAATEWAIGPQCGVMSILCTGRFPCRKTLATPNVDSNTHPDFWAAETYPYGYVTKFAGEDHDVEELKITAGRHQEAIEAIVRGVNARRLRAHDPRPILRVPASLSPADFLDRYAVLCVKRDRFGDVGRAEVDREYQRYAESYRQLTLPAAVNPLFQELLALHRESFDLLERLVPEALTNATALEHVAAIRANRRRTELKGRIDELCRSGYTEVKSYHRDPACFAVGQPKTAAPQPIVVQPPKVEVTSQPLPHPKVPVKVAELNGINLVRMNGHVYAVPQSIGPIKLDQANLSAYPLIQRYDDLTTALYALEARP